MTIFKPELAGPGGLPNLPLAITHPKHLVNRSEDFQVIGRNIASLGEKIGAQGVIPSGGFEDAMLKALDKVSAYQQISSNLGQMAITDPDSVDIHDITIAQAEAGMSLNITRNVLTRIVQGWRDIINTR
ncbi:MAG: flagellar hook-basal body complex protein FliE [Treponema sp.]|jgi:flagellar hook-basal body complex protein FliE|nr:flagellar hook-basal body complex protein FliE [Treponema sp.]